MVRPRHPAALVPDLDRRAFGGLSDGAKDTLIDRFLRWTFRRPHRRGPARALQLGEWLPIQPDYMQGEQPLGEGGMGVVHLWCCIDGNRRIRDRVIVKQVHPGVYSWERNGMWRDGVVGDEPRESMLGNEVYANLEASAAGHGKFVTECLGYGGMRDPGLDEDPATRAMVPTAIAAYKLYFEYCPFGDLRSAIIRQQNAGQLFHEGFIWMMFEALAECSLAMSQSRIVHADVTTSNILLSNNDPQRFKIWPTPMLSDFGSSHKINSATARRLTGRDEAMQPYFTPPELTMNDARTGWAVKKKLRVTRRTNVWGIGLIICCLMRLEPELPETVRTNNNPPLPRNQQLRFEVEGQREILTFQHASANYSRDLIRTVRACLKYDRNERPSSTALLRRIRRVMGNHLGGFDTYGTSSRIPWNKKERLQGNLKDIWGVGTEVEVRMDRV